MTDTTDLQHELDALTEPTGTTYTLAPGELLPAIADRWSTRAFDPTPVHPDIVASLLEAARWAPSAMNLQPWRFLVARRGEAAWQRVVDALAGGNRVWAERAPLLIVALAQTASEDGRPRPMSAYELGLAVGQLSVQAHAAGLSTHQMAGFDAAGIVSSFAVAAGWTPYVVVAVGHHDPEAPLPDHLREREQAPRLRHSVEDIAYGSRWGEPASLR